MNSIYQTTMINRLRPDGIIPEHRGDGDSPDVVVYLKAENDYLSAVMKHAEAFQEALFKEITGAPQAG